jgi:hypothetical protein
VSKGSRSRVENTRQFYENWEKIFGTTSKEERSREPERKQYIESYRPVEWGNTYFQEGCVRYAEYSIQYHPPTENN